MDLAYYLLKFSLVLKRKKQGENDHKLCLNCRAWVSGKGCKQDVSYSSTTTTLRGRFWLEDGAQNGCLLCIRFLAQFSIDELEAIHRRTNASTEAGEELVMYDIRWRKRSIFKTLASVHRFPSLLITVNSPDYHIRKKLFSVLIKDREQLIHLNAGFEHSTSSEKTMEIAVRWLQICNTEHKLCHSATDSFLPTRLIDVRSSQNGYVYLHENVINDGDVKYVTLSHCWGLSIPKRLLGRNFTEFKQGISLAEVSKTFQDAIIITQHLHIRYLWIDALCIIQDSVEDWNTEAAQMYKVYSSAYLNLGATSASDGCQGMFTNRDARSSNPLQLQILGQSSHLVNPEEWENLIENSPLNKRGWVCQERVLSKRNLHFTKSQVFWECKELSCSEMFPEFHPFVGFRGKPAVPTEIDDNETLHQRWIELVQLYSRTSLTKAGDKLIAFAGLAENWQKLLKDEYIAGMWRKSLATDLLWQTVGNGSHVAKETFEYLAPSWSWASILDAPVTFHNSTFSPDDMFVDITNATVELASRSVFGPVKYGYIILYGRLAEATYIPRTKSSEDDKWKLLTDGKAERDFTFTIHSRIDVDDGKMIPGRVFFLPVISCEVVSSYTVFGLLLRLTEIKLGQFARLGCFKLREESDQIGLWAACDYFDRKADELGTLRNDSGKYRITLI